MVGIDLVSGICDVCGCTFEQAEEAGGGGRGRGGGRTGGRGQTGQTGVRLGGWVVGPVVVARWMGFVGRVDDGFQGPDADLAVVARGRESLALRGWGKRRGVKKRRKEKEGGKGRKGKGGKSEGERHEGDRRERREETETGSMGGDEEGGREGEGGKERGEGKRTKWSTERELMAILGP